MAQQIILKNLQKPKEVNVFHDIDWLGESFGFYSGRDTDRITAKLLQSMLKEIAEEEVTSTEKLSEELDIAVQKANYHLKTFIDSGFIYREKRLILIRQGSVKAAVEEMRRDANRIFDNLSLIAEEIDKALGLKNRA